jgi:hypothetical protein
VLWFYIVKYSLVYKYQKRFSLGKYTYQKKSAYSVIVLYCEV